MRSLFAIYLAAGLTMAFALWMAVAHALGAYAGHDLLSLLQPGDDSQSVRDAINMHYREMAFALFLAMLQGMVIFYASRLSRELRVA